MRVSFVRGGLSWTTRCSRTLRCRAAHYVRVLVLTIILVFRSSRPCVFAATLQHLGLLGTASVSGPPTASKTCIAWDPDLEK